MLEGFETPAHNTRGFKPKTNGGDKGYHTAEFVTGMRKQGIVPHPALKAGQQSDGVRAVGDRHPEI